MTENHACYCPRVCECSSSHCTWLCSWQYPTVLMFFVPLHLTVQLAVPDCADVLRPIAPDCAAGSTRLCWCSSSHCTCAAASIRLFWTSDCTWRRCSWHTLLILVIQTTTQYRKVRTVSDTYAVPEGADCFRHQCNAWRCRLFQTPIQYLKVQTVSDTYAVPEGADCLRHLCSTWRCRPFQTLIQYLKVQTVSDTYAIPECADSFRHWYSTWRCSLFQTLIQYLKVQTVSDTDTVPEGEADGAGAGAASRDYRDPCWCCPAVLQVVAVRSHGVATSQHH